LLFATNLFAPAEDCSPAPNLKQTRGVEDNGLGNAAIGLSSCSRRRLEDFWTPFANQTSRNCPKWGCWRSALESKQCALTPIAGRPYRISTSIPPFIQKIPSTTSLHTDHIASTSVHRCPALSSVNEPVSC
jgi:hypothetical protein